MNQEIGREEILHRVGGGFKRLCKVEASTNSIIIVPLGTRYFRRHQIVVLEAVIQEVLAVDTIELRPELILIFLINHKMRSSELSQISKSMPN